MDRQFHQSGTVRTYKTSRIICALCEEGTQKSITNHKHFEWHLRNLHNIKVVHSKLLFPSADEFNAWFKDLVEETSSWFIKKQGSRTLDAGGSRSHYYCHRSGSARCINEETRKRRQRSQGTRKIGATCPARLTVDTKRSGVVHVDFCETHIGHANEPIHIPRSKRNLLSSKSADGEDKQPLERLHVVNVTKQESSNINDDEFFLQDEFILDEEDEDSSVDAWVEQETGLSEDSCVILYKPRGLASEEYGEEGLKDDDFLLAIMMNGQMDVLKSCGPGGIVAMDTTHGINANGYELTTLMVLDDLGQGFPAAFFISNRQDLTGIKIFLDQIKKRLGVIQAKTFMSNMAETFYSSWSYVMGPCQHRLFCSWHVIRLWKMELNSTISDIEVRNSTYAKIHGLLSEMDEEEFERRLPKVTKVLCSNSETCVFGEYFKKNYFKNRQWANCHRNDAAVTVNKHLERLHGALKCIFLKGKTVKRLDIAIAELNELIERKLTDRLLILQKGQLTYSLQLAQERHESSLSMSLANVAPVGDDSWTVVSQDCTDSDVVNLIPNNCSTTPCQPLCQPCQTCFHKYTCTCLDYSIHDTLCKHVHLVCRYLKTNKIFPTVETVTSIQLSTDDDDPEKSEAVTLLSISLRDFETQKKDSERRVIEEIHSFYRNMETVEEITAMENFIRGAGPVVRAARTNHERIRAIETPPKTISNNRNLTEECEL